MYRQSASIILSVGVGLAIGLALGAGCSLLPVHGQDTAKAEPSERIPVQGHGRAISSLRPPGEQFTLTASNAPRSAFNVVPPGKRFVLTDVMYETQASVRQSLTVNIANADPSDGRHEILFQVSLEPARSDQVHLCSGYIIPAGHTLVAFTNAGLAPDQYVSVSVTGYLADQ